MSRLEDLAVGPEGDSGAGLVGGLTRAQRARRGAVGEVHPMHEVVALDLHLHSGREGVDHRDADAVEAAGHGVAATTKLAPRVQDREHDLDCGLALALDDVDRDAATVVTYSDAAVGEDRHVDGVAVAGEGLVDGVVDDLVDEVVQTSLAGRADVHAGPLADGLETFEDGDVARVVGHGWVTLLPWCCRAGAWAPRLRERGEPH